LLAERIGREASNLGIENIGLVLQLAESSFGELEASSLFCPRCKRATPVPVLLGEPREHD
jgi:hypothetical protein